MDSKSRHSKTPPDHLRPMPVLEGVGAMTVVGGVLALVGTAVHPHMVQTFVPIGVVACLGGILTVRWARRAPPQW